MNRKWMNKTLLALSIQVAIGGAYAAEEPALGGYDDVEEPAAAVSTFAPSSANTATQPVNDQSQASSALQQQEGDASKEASLQEVFTSNERQYSLIKKGDISSYYDID